MHWNGATWTMTSTPNPSQPEPDPLKKVVAISTNDVWAVGGYASSYTLHWNGSNWTTVPLPATAPRADGVRAPAPRNLVEDISALASNDVWMVGLTDAADGSTLTLTMHWNGTQWTQVPSPNVPQPAGSALPYYPQSLHSVFAIASNNVWAVGYYRVGKSARTLILHWDGTQWSIVPSPNGPTSDGWLYGIAAAGPNDIWAVGEYEKPDMSSYGKALAMPWNGPAWSVVSPPDTGGFGVSALTSVVARSPNDFYAVGTRKTSADGLDTYSHPLERHDLERYRLQPRHRQRGKINSATWCAIAPAASGRSGRNKTARAALTIRWWNERPSVLPWSPHHRRLAQDPRQFGNLRFDSAFDR